MINLVLKSPSCIWEAMLKSSKEKQNCPSVFILKGTQLSILNSVGVLRMELMYASMGEEIQERRHKPSKLTAYHARKVKL